MKRIAFLTHEPFYPPNGLCLGGGLPTEGSAEPHLVLAVHLKAAALRISAHGRFHGGDR